MRHSRIRLGRWLLSALMVLAAGRVSCEAAELNLYDWSARAPVVLAGLSLGENGRTVEFRVEQVLRGEVQTGEVVLLDVRHSNRERDTRLHRKPLRLDAGDSFVLLLEPAYVRRKDGRIIYRLIRGIEGARLLPAEGAEARLAVLRRFIEIQDFDSEVRRWHRLEQLLEETDPLLLEAALDQFLRFRRGGVEQLGVLRPVLDHPSPELREKTARLVGAIVDRHGVDEVTGETELRAELIGRARRDESTVVRVAATEALESFGAARVREVLREIALDDPQQEVRYAAELILLRLDEGHGPGSAAAQGD